MTDLGVGKGIGVVVGVVEGVVFGEAQAVATVAAVSAHITISDSLLVTNIPFGSTGQYCSHVLSEAREVQRVANWTAN